MDRDKINGNHLKDKSISDMYGQYLQKSEKTVSDSLSTQKNVLFNDMKSPLPALIFKIIF